MTGPGKHIPLLVVGLGSIGQRHLKNLYSLGYTELYAVTSGKGTLPTEGLPLKGTSATLEAALERFSPEAVFVCNPTAHHLQTAIAAAKSGAHLFLEKPISDSWDGIETLEAEVSERGLKAAVGFQFRQHPTLGSLHRLIRTGKLGKVLSVYAEWGEYLPNWHPWEDYRNSYSAKADLGGGVTFTLCHPFDYLRWMLGEPVSVQASIKHTGSLDIPVDDLHVSLWEFEGGVTVTVKLDYLQRPGRHRVYVVGTEAQVHWDNATGSAEIIEKGEQKAVLSVSGGFGRNDLFIAELRDFMETLGTDAQPCCSLQDGIANMLMVLAARESSDSGRRVDMAGWTPGTADRK